VTLASARELRAVKAAIATSNDDDDAPRYKVMITRVGNKGAASTFRAADETIVQPGDVIEIKSRRPGGVSRLPSAASFEGDSSSFFQRVTH